MILKASMRGGALNLARHLLNDHDNDHIELHRVHGTIAQDVTGALYEMYAASRATKCTKHLFSLSLSPPPDANVTIQDFEDAIDQIKDRLGLNKTAHVILFHEKHGRRHCHFVASRIDPDTLKAVELSFFKNKLMDIARELYLSHGWELPDGLKNKALSDPRNYGLEEYHIAQRNKFDPREVKQLFQTCWQQSDGAKAFTAAMENHGLYIAKGDRRGFVAVDVKGTVYSLSRWTGAKTKELKARLGDPASYLSVEETQAKIAATLSETQNRLLQEIEDNHHKQMEKLLAHKRRIVDRHRQERQELLNRQKDRAHAEALERNKRLRKGIMGLWDWVTGKRQKMKALIAQETEHAKQRDEAERQVLRQRQLKERREIQKLVSKQKKQLSINFKKLQNAPCAQNTQANHSVSDRNFVASNSTHENYNFEIDL
jgi:hypothetical protein